MPLRAWRLVAVAALVGCLSHPAYDARGFSCASDADCDSASECFYALCRARVTDAGFPSASTTGVPKGTVLHADAGVLKLRVDGGIVDSLDLLGCIEVHANGVTIQRTRIHCEGNSAIGIADGVTGTVIRDVEITGGSVKDSVAVSGEHLQAIRVNASDLDRGFVIGNDVSIEESYLHGPGTSGIYGNGNVGIRILHNRIDIPIDSSNAIFFGTYFGPVSEVLVQHNLLSGGGWTVQISGDGGTSVRVIDNRFGTFFAYGPITFEDGRNIESGNVWDDGGVNIDEAP